MRRNIYLYLGLIFLLTGIFGLVLLSARPTTYPGPMGPGPRGRPPRGFNMDKMMRFMMRDYSKPSYASNGERIYLTGEDEKGRRLQSNMGNMPMMRNFSCVHCHGPSARGGLVFPNGDRSANITWRELTVGEKKEGKPSYNDRLLKRAITQGIDNQGKPLGSYMPRWRLPPEDLDDLVKYIKKL